MITYIPTYSGRAYDDLNLIQLILILLVVNYESNTKVGKKSKVLLNRLQEMWDGKPEKNEKKEKPSVKISQPISGLTSPVPTHQSSRADYIGMQNQIQQPQQEQQNSQNNNGASNNMYENAGFNGLSGVTQPMMQEPMAANSMGGGFTSW